MNAHVPAGREPWCMCASQGTIWGSWFCPLTLYTLETELSQQARRWGHYLLRYLFSLRITTLRCCLFSNIPYLLHWKEALWNGPSRPCEVSLLEGHCSAEPSFHMVTPLMCCDVRNALICSASRWLACFRGGSAHSLSQIRYVEGTLTASSHFLSKMAQAPCTRGHTTSLLFRKVLLKNFCASVCTHMY